MNSNFRQKTLGIILLITLVFSACGSPEFTTEEIEDMTLPLVEYPLEGFISVHMEVYTGLELIQKWSEVQDLVVLADEYGLKLTLGFTANWAELFLNDETALSLLNDWERNGHEISAHHHGVSHAVWDGYTNDNSYRKDPRYKGDIEEMMEVLDQFTLSDGMLSGSMTDPETDWPESLIYKSYGDPFTKHENILSEPELVVFNGTEVTQVLKAGYLTGKAVDVDLEYFVSAIETADHGEFLGLALSDSGLGDEGVLEGIEDIFTLLDNEEVQIQTLSSLLE